MGPDLSPIAESPEPAERRTPRLRPRVATGRHHAAQGGRPRRATRPAIGLPPSFAGRDSESVRGAVVPPPPVAAEPADTLAPQLGGEVEISTAIPVDQRFHDRYAVHRLLGHGGMGEVHLCFDGRVGRYVAMKVAHADEDNAALASRFEHEARIQGSLEHPSIVPVYDLGRRPDDALYFTMKRVRGDTLTKILSRLRRGDEDTARDWTRRRLLAAFGQACLAVEFAHRKGVLHCDLKPDNVMLGAFGEVYVLDWGVARTLDTQPRRDRESTEPSIAPTPPTSGDAIVGTPGYISPEQVCGLDLDERADVYSLGAILFELLALEPMHAPGAALQVLTRTVQGVRVAPGERASSRDIPAALDAICLRATAPERNERTRSARDLHDEIERFLDHDRDVTRRQEIADDLAARAIQSLRPRDEGVSRPTLDPAFESLTSAVQAVALSPEHSGARRVLLTLLDAPARLPPEVEARLARAHRPHHRTMLRVATWVRLSWLGLAPVLRAEGASWPLLGAFAALALAAMAATAWHRARERVDLRALSAAQGLGVVALAVAAAAPGVGMTPGLALVDAMVFVQASTSGRERRVSLALGLLAVLVTVALSPWPTSAMVAVPGAVVLLLAAWHRSVSEESERLVAVQSWRIRRLADEG